jgi:DNA sulfur modification protein DndE
MASLKGAKMPIDTVRLVETDRDLLNRLKKSTGIKNWNVLCRWSFCLSLRDPGRTTVDPSGNISNVEMTWRVFAGPHADTYWALLIHRVHEDGIELTDENIEKEFNRHLHRGIGNLASLSNKPSIKEILALVV